MLETTLAQARRHPRASSARCAGSFECEWAGFETDETATSGPMLSARCRKRVRTTRGPFRSLMTAPGRCARRAARRLRRHHRQSSATHPQQPPTPMRSPRRTRALQAPHGSAVQRQQPSSRWSAHPSVVRALPEHNRRRRGEPADRPVNTRARSFQNVFARERRRFEPHS